MNEPNEVVNVIQTERNDGKFEVVFVLQNGAKTDKLIFDQPIDIIKLLKGN
ncbi:hypothetical protein [Mammaliicoccus sciuri]|uniref:hypothetical protein n=1 Tax=Mammaliicoccus sciuri TaxID=1296 RepID=UPI002DBCDA4B|nr:hypothetical protein [Mammaliicoccus sciuri]MEB8206558.1 hypothetical protein [Mammaliicoccus sciuri]